MSLQDRYDYLAELSKKKEYTELTGAFLKLFLDTNFKYIPENFDAFLSEKSSADEKETVANNMLNTFKDALQKNEITESAPVGDKSVDNDDLLAADSEIDFFLELINKQEYEKFAFYTLKLCLDNDIKPRFPKDMEKLVENEVFNDTKNAIAYTALIELINTKSR